MPTFDTSATYSFVETLLDDLFHMVIQTVIQERSFPSFDQTNIMVDRLLEKNNQLESADKDCFRDRLQWALMDCNIGQIQNQILSHLMADTTADGGTRDFYREMVFKIEPEEVPNKLMQEVSLYPGLTPVLRLPGAFLLALQSNHIAVLNTGITSGLSADLYELLKKIWQNASNHLHPFQKGATHQGTRHCHVVNKNLNEIGKHCTLSPEEGFVLKVAAAIHDLGKAHVEGSNAHQLVGYNFVRSQHLDLLIPSGLEEAVALVVRYHDGDEPLDSITSLLTDTLHVCFFTKGNEQKLDVRLKNLAAIFRLADVMDMTSGRVSDIVYSISRSFTPSLKMETQRKIISRKCVKSTDFNTASNKIDVTTFPSLSSYDRTLLQDGIAFENAKLSNTTTSSLLTNIGLPGKFDLIFP